MLYTREINFSYRFFQDQSCIPNAEDFVKVSTKTKKRVSKIILNAIEKIRITLRLGNQTLDLIKQKSQDEELPYQTFISSILYKFANDKLVDEKQILKSIQLFNK